MPRYHFHIEDGVSFVDKEGIVLVDIQAARSEAARLANALLVRRPELFWTGRVWKVVVTTSEGDMLIALKMAGLTGTSVPGLTAGSAKSKEKLKEEIWEAVLENRRRPLI